MHRKYNKFLIVSLIGVISLGVYSYFYNDLKSEAATEDGESLTSSLTTPVVASVNNGNATLNEDTAFLMKLGSLKRIKIDVSLFGNKAFTGLVNNTVKIDPIPYGRANPFSPINGQVVVNNKPAYALKTNIATSITNKSAVLMGTLEGATSNNIYFEYGLTETPDKVTPKLIPSMVGNFAFNINQLTSKTTYFYRSAANINGVLVFGDVMSFNTN